MRRVIGLLAAAITALALVLGVAGPASAAGSNPIGVLDEVRVIPGGISVRGWTIDADAPTTPTDVHVYADGRLIGATNAGGDRPDIANAFPGYGPHHGFYGEFPLGGAGSHQVCVYAINLGPSGGNPQIGCKTVAFSRSLRCEWPRCTLYFNRTETYNFAYGPYIPNTPSYAAAALWVLLRQGLGFMARSYYNQGYCIGFQVSALPWDTQSMFPYRC